MRIVQIPKKTRGQFRTIYVPDAEEKMRLRSLAGEIEKKARRACPGGVAHGFTRFRSPVTNAQAHVGHSYSLCFDLADFFDTVTADRLKGKLSAEELALVLVDGAARQGLPTSPAVANLAAADLDKAILKWIGKRKYQIIYTRYADDLTFSFDDIALAEILRREVPQIVSRCGFRINHAKTHFMASAQGRRIITGIGVDVTGIHPTRRAKRRLRAALHQGNQAQAQGLAEWCKLKSPRTPEARVASEAVKDEIAALSRAWKLGKLPVAKMPQKKTEQLSEDIIITGDPIYMLGMSTWTTGWTSCMSQPNGQYRKGVLFWCFLRGTRIAALLSRKTKTVAGVERRVMRARTLVHELRNGKLCYDRIYGNPGDIDELRTALEAAGIQSIPTARKNCTGVAVVGHAPKRYVPYLDNLTATLVTAKTGPWTGQKVRVIKL